MKFTCEMFHPNIYKDGAVCISILHSPGNNPNQCEDASERWSPVQSVEKILISVMSMLAGLNNESSANIDASNIWRGNRKEYIAKLARAFKDRMNFRKHPELSRLSTASVAFSTFLTLNPGFSQKSLIFLKTPELSRRSTAFAVSPFATFPMNFLAFLHFCNIFISS